MGSPLIPILACNMHHGIGDVDLFSPFSPSIDIVSHPVSSADLHPMLCCIYGRWNACDYLVDASWGKFSAFTTGHHACLLTIFARVAFM